MSGETRGVRIARMLRRCADDNLDVTRRLEDIFQRFEYVLHSRHTGVVVSNNAAQGNECSVLVISMVYDADKAWGPTGPIASAGRRPLCCLLGGGWC